MSKQRRNKETGVFQRHTRSCPRTADGGGYAPHRCAGSWSYVLDVGRDSTGKRIQETKGGFASREEASAARAARRLLLRHRPVDAHRLTLAEYLPQWLEGKRRLRPSTRESYTDYVDRLFVPRLGEHRLVTLEANPALVEGFFTWLATEATDRFGRRLAPATQQRIHAVLRGAFNAAVKRRLITFNPVLAVELPEVPRPLIRVWTAEQLVQFLVFLGGDPVTGRPPERLRALFYQAATTGMRRGELLGQRWDVDLDLAQGCTLVAETRVQTRAGVVVGPPKTRKGERTVTLDPGTVKVLTEHRARMAAERAAWAAAGGVWVDSDLVHVAEDGSPLRPDRVTRRFAALVRQAGLPEIPLKNLRHTSLTLALDAGVHLKVVSERAGHSSAWFTADTYTQVVSDVARAAAEAIGQVISLETARQTRRTTAPGPDGAGPARTAADAQVVSAM